MILLKSIISLINLGLAIIFLTTYSGDGEDELLDGILGWEQYYYWRTQC